MTMINGVDRENLRKLADYLATLPEDYTHFNMSDYAKNNPSSYFAFPRDIAKGALAECGTVACAVGHGPAAGIVPWEYEDWPSYVRRNFIDIMASVKYYDATYRVWSWCFDAGWTPVDNTPQGAASRIYWYLDRGVPSNAARQICREAPLCYAGYGPEENQ